MRLEPSRNLDWWRRHDYCGFRVISFIVPAHDEERYVELRNGRKRLIKKLWREHKAAPFPKASRGREVAGWDLVLLDAATAGCLSTFVERGTLDTWRLAGLGLCYHDLVRVVLEVDGEEHAYFDRLERLAGLVLEAVCDGSQRD